MLDWKKDDKNITGDEQSLFPTRKKQGYKLLHILLFKKN